MKDITPVKGKYYIEKLISEGEHEHQDFKFAISDARKIARSVSAFANHGGGRLLIGVKDNGSIAGVRNDEDVYVVEQAAQRYCRPAQDVEFTAYNVGQGVVVIKATISRAAERPVMACDTDGSWKSFYRIADENIIAHPLMVRAWEMNNDMSTQSRMFSLSAVESSLLDLLDETDDIAVRDVAIRMHVSSAVADDIIAKLAAFGILEFNYIGNGEFVISRTKD